MRFVKSINEIKNNMTTLDDYLSEKHDPEYSFALDLIKNGICFIAASVNSSYRFYPSRFIGYANNTMNKHEKNEWKDGRKTKPVISQILNQKYVSDAELEIAYREYCESLGFTPRERGAFGVERKYLRMKCCRL